MSMQAMTRWLGEPKKVALLLAAGLAAVAALGLASAASAATFSNTDGPITINDGSQDCFGGVATQVGQATPYPSVIAVSGLGSSVTDVNVTVSGLSHTWPDDVGLLLVSPTGQSTILMTDSGSSDPVGDITLVFDDDASGGLPNASQLSSGTYKPSVGSQEPGVSCGAPQSFPLDATGTNPPAGPYSSSLAVFNGSDPNGTWKLYVIDDGRLDAGSITGWSLDISATTPFPATKDECKKGGWSKFGFSDQGTCITAFNENRP